MHGMRLKVVDLFCGIGGLSYGFKAQGFDVLAGIDSDASCRFAYEKNVGADFISADIRTVSGTKVNRLFGKRGDGYRVLIGCAPCTPFSMYSGRYRKGKSTDARWQLLEEFSRLIRESKPDVVSMENVPRLTRYPVFDKFVTDLEAAGYAVTYAKIRSDHYGVPQRRARLVLIASRWGEVPLPKPTHRNCPVTVREAIGQLPKIAAGVPCPTDRLHITRRLSPRNLERLRATGEGGSWKDWDQRLQLKCHKKAGGKSFRSVYGRMKWDSPGPVITTQCLGIGNGRFGHPEQDRAISVREAALLQTFPKKFEFVPDDEPLNGMQLARQIGNAVPVKLGHVIAKAIKSHIAAATGS
jgi:DNA (cytosine-5)-methyltransferase 1